MIIILFVASRVDQNRLAYGTGLPIFPNVGRCGTLVPSTEWHHVNPLLRAHPHARLTAIDTLEEVTDELLASIKTCLSGHSVSVQTPTAHAPGTGVGLIPLPGGEAEGPTPARAPADPIHETPNPTPSTPPATSAQPREQTSVATTTDPPPDSLDAVTRTDAQPSGETLPGSGDPCTLDEGERGSRDILTWPYFLGYGAEGRGRFATIPGSEPRAIRPGATVTTTVRDTPLVRRIEDDVAAALRTARTPRGDGMGKPPLSLLLATARAESGFDVTSRGSAREVGYFQIHPIVAQQFGVTMEEAATHNGNISTAIRLFMWLWNHRDIRPLPAQERLDATIVAYAGGIGYFRSRRRPDGSANVSGGGCTRFNRCRGIRTLMTIYERRLVTRGLSTRPEHISPRIGDMDISFDPWPMG